MVRKLEAELGWRCDETHRQQHTEVFGADFCMIQRWALSAHWDYSSKDMMGGLACLAGRRSM